MRRLKLVLLVFLCASFHLSSALVWAESISKDQQVLKEALEAIDLCMHWGGETPYDEERGKDIAEGADRDCPAAHDKAIRAYKLFPDSEKLAEPLLLLNDAGYFELSQEEKKNICAHAITAFRQQYEKTKYENPFVRLQCPAEAKEIYGK